MQPISGPIPVPGTQREPTTPPVSDVGVLPSTSGSSTPNTAASPRSSLSGKSNTTSVKNNNIHQRDSSAGSSPVPVASYNQNHQQYHHGSYHERHNNNVNSGLRRFPSIGNTTKLHQENSTLRAKIVELERYLTGLKEELILAHRQIHAQRAELKDTNEAKSEEMSELKEKVLKYERELEERTVECGGLRGQLQEKSHVENDGGAESTTKKQENSPVPAPVSATLTTVNPGLAKSSNTSSSKNRSADLDRIKDLEEENKRKDAQIKQLLEKVDRLGTEVLNLERDKARLEQPLRPEPISTTRIPTTTATPLTTNTTLNNLVPITAEAIIAATTPSSASSSHNLAGSASSSSFKSSSTSPSTVESDSNSPSTPPSVTVQVNSTANNVGYDLTIEHPKLLAKFQALRMQHAQASEYVDSLESENRDLKVQLLDVCTGSAFA
ncbi:hypothetical protein FBU30_008516 [Linnemannia zychae]|nr:hypothetical protein FBU30_008516 [Linnemannia zychae]